MHLKSYLIIFLLTSPGFFQAQNPAVKKEKLFGGSGSERFYAIKPASDGGFFICGNTNSWIGDGDVFDQNYKNNFRQTQENDCWIIKLRADMTIQWQRIFGGNFFDAALAIQETPDNGCIVAGYMYSTDGDAVGHHWCTTDKCKDAWVAKLRKDGSTEWQKLFGGSSDDQFSGVQLSNDGGYVLVGYTNSNDGDLSGNFYHDISNNVNYSDAWLVKLDYQGNLQYQKLVGGTSKDEYTAIERTADGGYVVSGFTNSNDGDLAGVKTTFYRDAWITKLDANFNKTWQRTSGVGEIDTRAYSVAITKTGDYVVGGITATGGYGESGLLNDFYLVKFSQDGNLAWQKRYGGSNDDYARSVTAIDDGSVVITGYTISNDGDVSGFHGTRDGWVLHCDANGNKIEQFALGGWDYDYVYASTRGRDGNYYFAGYTKSPDGDITVKNHGDFDAWVFQLSLTGVKDSVVGTPVSLSSAGADIAIGISSTPQLFKQYTQEVVRLTAQNTGKVAFKEVNIFFKFPNNTVTSGYATSSAGVWHEYCAGGDHCYTWNIDALPVGTTATANIPIFILGNDKTVFVSTSLVGSIPRDTLVANNEAHFTVSNVLAEPQLVQSTVPNSGFMSDQKLSPNPTDYDINIEVTAPKTLSGVFTFYNALGSIVLQENRKLETGYNKINFLCTDFPSGVYYIVPTITDNSVPPMRFVKY